MPNQFITLKNIARRTLTRLTDNILFPQLCYRNYADTFQKRGDTIQIPVPVKLEAKDFNQESGVEFQDDVEESVDLKLDKLATVDIEYTAIQSATNVDDLDALFIQPAASALAEKINRDGFGLYSDIRNCVGTPGTLPDSLSAFADATLLLNENKAPQQNRYAVWSPYATSRLQQIPAIVTTSAYGTNETILTGEIGKVFGLRNFMSQAVANHIAGSLAGTSYTLTVSAKSAGSVELTASASSGTPSISGKTLVRGDLLLADDHTLLVSADCTASSATKITVPVDEASYAAAKVGDTVTVAANHDANLVFHKEAFAFATRPLMAPAGAESYTVTNNGISLRVVRSYDQKYKKDLLSMDVLYGYKTIRPELAVRYMG